MPAADTSQSNAKPEDWFVRILNACTNPECDDNLLRFLRNPTDPKQLLDSSDDQKLMQVRWKHANNGLLTISALNEAIQNTNRREAFLDMTLTKTFDSNHCFSSIFGNCRVVSILVFFCHFALLL